MKQPFTVILVFTDNDTLTIPYATEAFIQDECLHIYNQDGEFAPREHIGTYPLTNLYTYKQAPR